MIDSRNRRFFFVVLAAWFLTLASLATAETSSPPTAPDAANAEEPAALPAELATDENADTVEGDAAEPAPLFEPDPIFASGDDPCTTSNYYWLCHGWCYDGDRCVKRCSFATHECCAQLFCVPPETMCFE